MGIDINCDMGESFSLYSLGQDEALMPLITQANIACGFHGSDPNHMATTVANAMRHGVRIGAHFSTPDLQGFGRREMKIDREEMKNVVLYQVGALKGFVDHAGGRLAHLKAHGALYGMAARYEHIAHAICDATEHLDLPIFGLAGTLHEEIFTQRGFDFRAEFFADLDYDDEGGLIITREHASPDPDTVAEKVKRAVEDGTVASASGKVNPVKAQTICVHSDTPNAVAVAKAVRTALGDRITT